MIIDGIFGSEAVDSSGEVLDVAGADISDWEAGTLLLNWDHNSEEKGASSLVGKVIYAKKIYKESDCENERQRGYWKKCECPFIYGIARLFDESGHKHAQDIAAIIRDCVANKEPITIRYSVEGSTIQKDGNRLVKTIIKRLAVTAKPCNRTAVSGVLTDDAAPPGFDKSPDKKNKDLLEGIVDTEKKEASGFRRLGGSLSVDVLDPTIQKNGSTKKLYKALIKKHLLEKAISLGGGAGAPSTLTGGAALQREDIDKKVVRKEELNVMNGVSIDEARQLALTLAANLDDIQLEEFRTGIAHEREHANVTDGDPADTARIALAHLKEDPEYYKKLSQIEKSQRKWFKNQIRSAIRDYSPDKGDFKKFIKNRLPEVSDEFLDHFENVTDEAKVKLKKSKVSNPVKAEGLSIDLHKAADAWASLHKAEDKPQTVDFGGKTVKPGHGRLSSGENIHILHADDNHVVAVPDGKLGGWHGSDLMKLPRNREGLDFQVHTEPAEHNSPSIMTAVLHGRLNVTPEQKALVEGFDPGPRTRLRGQPTNATEGTGHWHRLPGGKLAYVKNADSSPDNPINEVVFHNLAHQFFGLGEYVPTTAAAVNPQTGSATSIQEHVPGAQHINYAGGDRYDNVDSINSLAHSGELDKLALMDLIVGNGDRHRHNLVTSHTAPHLKLIDNANALEYNFTHTTPATWHIPTVNSDGNFLAEKMHPDAQKWLAGLDEGKLRDLLTQNRQGHVADRAAQALTILKQQASKPRVRILKQFHKTLGQ